jgi:uncharacterized protein YndB with AHSA1/START domain
MPSTEQSAILTLPADNQIRVVREFDAPRHLVYRAWTDPELVKRWWHANRGEVTLVERDLRPGGAWRQVMVTPDGFEVGFHGEYSEVVENERLVYSETYEAAPDDSGQVTITFTESAGRTTVEMLMEFTDQGVRDTVIRSGMEDGLQDALDLLEALAASRA